MALSVNFFVKQAAERAGVKPAASIHSRSDWRFRQLSKVLDTCSTSLPRT